MEQILIVEDDTDINNMMASALTKAGYECKQSFSGTEAMLYLNKEKFSVMTMRGTTCISVKIEPLTSMSAISVRKSRHFPIKNTLKRSGA